MEGFVLKIIGIISVTLFSIIIVIARKDDIDIWSVVIATVFELIAIFMIYMPNLDNIVILIERLKNIL